MVRLSLDLAGAGVQMRDSNEAFLKVFQSFVRQDGRAIWLRTSATGFTFFLEGPENPISVEELANGFASFFKGDAEPSAARDLAVGLAAFSAQKITSTWWAEIDDRSERVALSRLSGEASEVAFPNPPQGASGPMVALHLERASQFQQYYSPAAISRRVAFSPVPIYHYGDNARARLLSSNNWSPAVSITSQAQRITNLLAELYRVVPGLGHWGLGLKPVGAADIQRDGDPLGWGGQPQGAVRCWHRWFVSDERIAEGDRFSVSSPTETRSQFRTVTGQHVLMATDSSDAPLLWPVQAGVMLAPVALNLPLPGFHIVAAAPDVDVDASTLAVTAGDPLNELIADLRPDLAKFIELLHGEIDVYPMKAGCLPGCFFGWLVGVVLASIVQAFEFGLLVTVISPFLGAFLYNYLSVSMLRERERQRLVNAATWLNAGL